MTRLTPEAQAALWREPLYCSQGGVPYNQAHLAAKDQEIESLKATIEELRQEVELWKDRCAAADQALEATIQDWDDSLQR